MGPIGEKVSENVIVGMGHMLLREINSPLFKGEKGNMGEIFVATHTQRERERLEDVGAKKQ
jgi:hypothetical protein